MTSMLSGLLAVILYSVSAWLQRQTLTQSGTTGASTEKGDDRRPLIFALAAAALLVHLLNAFTIVDTPAGFDFGFFRVASLFSWAMALIVVLSSWKRPLNNLFLALFPLAIISILCSLFLPSRYDPQPEITTGVALHIALGIFAFSLITIAAVQAGLLAWLSRELKQHHYTPVLRHLPPLQTMEELLFEIIKAGFVSLLAVIVTGFLFMDDMFAQHLVHKTGLTIISWGVFGILLWGRHRQGWRGRTALRWTLAGFVVLILAYFGSKFVLELLLDRV